MAPMVALYGLTVAMVVGAFGCQLTESYVRYRSRREALRATFFPRTWRGVLFPDCLFCWPARGLVIISAVCVTM